MSGFLDDAFDGLLASNVPLPHEDRLLDVQNGFKKGFQDITKKEIPTDVGGLSSLNDLLDQPGVG